MNWTTSAGLRSQLEKYWAKGLILRELVVAGELFPLRLSLKVPGSSDLSTHFDAVREWVRNLQHDAKGESGKGYRLAWRSVRHPVIGSNSLPKEAWVDTLDDALSVIGKAREAKRFAVMVEQTRTRMPALLPWLAKNPLRALDIVEDWPRLLDISAWLSRHPRPGIYVRQVDLPGVHSKFIEDYRAVLAELFDCVLPPETIDASVSGVGAFAKRYGFCDKPVRVRFRVLDVNSALLPGCKDQDITVSHDTFSCLDPRVSRVFITENEVNFLAFPDLEDSLVIFGGGYGFDMLQQAQWLHTKAVYYWGDLDTHGFAILDQLRNHLPHAVSFLMDSATLMAHREQWVTEPQPILRDLPRLTLQERAVYDSIRWQRLQDNVYVRLEQERISFGWLMQALKSIRPLAS